MIGGLVWRGRGFSVVLQPRVIIVTGILVIAALGLGVTALNQGAVSIPLDDVIPAILGEGESRHVLAMELRLPRVAAAITAGTALGISGAIFQSISNNALGSPDIIGLTTGAASGAITQIVLFDGGPISVMLAALAGALIAALLIYLLSLKGGVTGGFRLVLIGLGVGALLSSLNSLLIVRGDVEAAFSANIWIAGSLDGRRWAQVLPAMVGTVLAVPIAVALARRATMLEMGDDIARQMGIHAENTRRWLLLCAVLLAALATAAVGPIAFIALAAPQVARRLTRAQGLSVLPAGAMGACLLMGADVITQSLPTRATLPIGQMTGLVGGIYLGWLLTRSRQV